LKIKSHVLDRVSILIQLKFLALDINFQLSGHGYFKLNRAVFTGVCQTLNKLVVVSCTSTGSQAFFSNLKIARNTKHSMARLVITLRSVLAHDTTTNDILINPQKADHAYGYRYIPFCFNKSLKKILT